MRHPKQGADLPLLLVFAGVIGGLIAVGIIRYFIIMTRRDHHAEKLKMPEIRECDKKKQ